eukprot:TRINITY_DN773090_c0_g1_i1.p1 TRINITY_DN773090_c0_g1~~TRINITY_DN773090_c0_g1_i1.p1  ORF type:complete len:422 (+),score=114.52 TRINITY_DN773090_c0_g1_i1:213-1478(+)
MADIPCSLDILRTTVKFRELPDSVQRSLEGIYTTNGFLHKAEDNPFVFGLIQKIGSRALEVLDEFFANNLRRPISNRSSAQRIYEDLLTAIRKAYVFERAHSRQMEPLERQDINRGKGQLGNSVVSYLNQLFKTNQLDKTHVNEAGLMALTELSTRDALDALDYYVSHNPFVKVNPSSTLIGICTRCKMQGPIVTLPPPSSVVQAPPSQRFGNPAPATADPRFAPPPPSQIAPKYGPKSVRKLIGNLVSDRVIPNEQVIDNVTMSKLQALSFENAKEVLDMYRFTPPAGETNQAIQICIDRVVGRPPLMTQAQPAPASIQQQPPQKTQQPPPAPMGGPSSSIPSQTSSQAPVVLNPSNPSSSSSSSVALNSHNFDECRTAVRTNPYLREMVMSLAKDLANEMFEEHLRKSIAEPNYKRPRV